MRLLLDESLPRKLKNNFAPHEVWTVPEMGWAGKKNGALLALAQDFFDVFLTADQGLPAQQNLTMLRIGIIMAAKTNRLGDLEPLVPQTLKAIDSLSPGSGPRSSLKGISSAR